MRNVLSSSPGRATGALLACALLTTSACDSEPPPELAPLSKEEARSFALEELEVRRADPASGWGAESQFTQAFPIYLDGRDSPSYYEFKVVTAGEDDGYVLVNVDRSDILIPEVTLGGKSLTEQYQEVTGRDDVRVVRYDWFRSAVWSDDGAALIGAAGFAGGLPPQRVDEDSADELAQGVRAFATTYRLELEQSGAVPQEDRENLDAFYSALAEEAGAPEGGLATRQLGLSGSTTRHYLAHSFGTDSGGRQWYLPQFYQPLDSDGYAVGCGPTAWTMVYAYWDRFKGKSQLLPGADLHNQWNSWNCCSTGSVVNKAMWRLNKLMDTRRVDNGKQGLTWPWGMRDGIDFAEEKGYTQSDVELDRGIEKRKWEKIRDEIKADRPAILTIHTDGVGLLPEHYVGIMGTELKTRKWYKRDTRGYLANYGWRNVQKWIYTTGDDDTSAFGAYLITVK